MRRFCRSSNLVVVLFGCGQIAICADFLFILFFSGRGRAEKCVQIAFEFRVVELAGFVRTSAEVLFERAVRCDYVRAPFVLPPENFSEVAVKFFELVFFHQPFAVGRVGDDYAVSVS